MGNSTETHGVQGTNRTIPRLKSMVGGQTFLALNPIGSAKSLRNPMSYVAIALRIYGNTYHSVVFGSRSKEEGVTGKLSFCINLPRTKLKDTVVEYEHYE